MKGEAEAVAYGAATIINAIATGRGIAFGVDLWTRAKVRIVDMPKVIRGRILSNQTEGTALIESAVRHVFRHLEVENQYGAFVDTTSNIPVARGLKSSSVAANAIVLATNSALRGNLTDMQMVNIAVDAAIDARTTITGAFDDACASYFGNVIATDNTSRKIEREFRFENEDAVLFYIPPKKAYTIASNVARMKLIAPLVEIAHKEAFSGNLWEAMTLNGLVYSAALGYSADPAIEALETGASAVSLSGKGPAVTAVVPRDRLSSLLRIWERREGRVIQAHFNRKKAFVVSSR